MFIPNFQLKHNARRFVAHKKVNAKAGFNSRKGFSAIEITATLIVILLTLLSFRGYIQRSFTGRWKAAGDAFGQSKQYDPSGFGDTGESGGTLDCFFDPATNHWVNEDLYKKNKCDCTLLRVDGVTHLPGYDDQCVECKKKCWDDARCAK